RWKVPADAQRISSKLLHCPLSRLATLDRVQLAALEQVGDLGVEGGARVADRGSTRRTMLDALAGDERFDVGALRDELLAAAARRERAGPGGIEEASSRHQPEVLRLMPVDPVARSGGAREQ